MALQLLHGINVRAVVTLQVFKCDSWQGRQLGWGWGWGWDVGSPLLQWGQEGWKLQVQQELRRMHRTGRSSRWMGIILCGINPVIGFVLCACSWQALGAEDGKVPVWLPGCHKLCSTEQPQGPAQIQSLQ